MMMKSGFISGNKGIVLFFIIACSIGCNQTEYTKVVKRELATGKQYNEMMFDMNIGLSKKNSMESVGN